jgi:hypothetical protein
MSTIASFSVRTRGFPLGRELATHSGVEPALTLDRLVPMDGTLVVYGRAETSDPDELRRALPGGRPVEILDETDRGTLFRLELEREVDGFVDAMVETGAKFLQGVERTDGWQFSLRFDDYDAMTAFYHRCSGDDVDITVDELHTPGDRRGSELLGLTRPQQEALVVAVESGYYDVPRQATLEELADRLGISDSAVSQRLRRGTARLVRSSIPGVRRDGV